MIRNLNDWMCFLKTCDPLMGIPFVAGGLILLLLGWRMWQISTVLTFALIGLGLGTYFAQSPTQQVLYGGAGALILGAASMPPVVRSVAVLGGLVGTGIAYFYLEKAGLFGPPLWIACGLSFTCLTALAVLNYREVIVVITSFQGAVLLMSGLFVLLLAQPSLYNGIRDMTYHVAIVGPFCLLVPTVVGTFLQMADIRQKDRGH